MSMPLVLAACVSTPPPPVAVFAETPDLVAFSGTWSGRYWSGSSRRSGRISFFLEIGTGEPLGEIVMYPRSRTSDGRDLSPDPSDYEAAERVGIRFVRMSENEVDGKTEVYTDPACGCRVTTRFVGSLRGDVIEGTYRSEGGLAHVSHSGYWWVERLADRSRVDPEPSAPGAHRPE